jgi:phage N-6-adenine-methyltransferase
MNNAVMFSSATDEWATPQAFFDKLDLEFDFDLDVAASSHNTKCGISYYGPDHIFPEYRDGLAREWSIETNGACWMNPPYSRGLQGKFIAKAAQERLRGVLTVALLPARTDTKAFHTHIYDASRWQPRDGIEIRLLPGRLKFGGAVNSAPFPSMVVIFRP